MSSFREINSDIIIRYLEGKLTGEEKAFLVEWLEKDKENRDFLFGVKEMYLAGKWKDISRKADTSTEWERLRGAVSKKAMPQRSGMRHYYIRAMRYPAIAAVLALCFGLGLFYRDSFRNEQFYRVETNAGERALVSLPDGSTIRLNSMSLLSYPSDFSDENRQVSLKGEAAFDISASEEHPFRVHTGEYTVKVKGTKFNVSAYLTDSLVRTTLKEGRVEIENLHDDASYSCMLEPGESFSYNRNSGVHGVEKVNADFALDWINGDLILRNTSLDQVLVLLERRFGCHFEMNDRELARLSYSAVLKDEPLNEILDYIMTVTPEVVFTKNNREEHIVVSRRME